MSEQLARMATQLKRNAMHFANSLENDKAVVQDAHEKMERNYAVMTKERVRLRDHRSKSWGTTWLVMLGLAGAGLLSCLLMREEKMREALDEQWGLQDKNSAEKGSLEGAQKDVESAGSGGPVRGETREVPPRVE